ncbi:hypothetical protein O5472_26860, partial [Escherichia coli]|nr:hypothetical protein [Escherichia coli]
MKQYLELMQKVLDEGTQKNREYIRAPRDRRDRYTAPGRHPALNIFASELDNFRHYPLEAD